MKYIKEFESDVYESYSRDRIRQKFEDELSRHLLRTPSNDFKYHDANDKYFFNDALNLGLLKTIYLLNSEYGARIQLIIGNTHHFSVKIISIKKREGKDLTGFRDGSLGVCWHSNRNISIEDFVNDFIIKLKKTNSIRIKNKERFELRKMNKKYNL